MNWTEWPGQTGKAHRGRRTGMPNQKPPSPPGGRKGSSKYQFGLAPGFPLCSAAPASSVVSGRRVCKQACSPPPATVGPIWPPHHTHSRLFSRQIHAGCRHAGNRRVSFSILAAQAAQVMPCISKRVFSSLIVCSAEIWITPRRVIHRVIQAC